MPRKVSKRKPKKKSPSLVEVEIFWDGDGWYFAHKNVSERLGGPHPRIHACWEQAHNEGYEVTDVNRTRAMRSYRKTLPHDDKAVQEVRTT